MADLQLAEVEERFDDFDSDADDDADEKESSKPNSQRKIGEEMFLKTSQDGVETRCDRIEYFYRPQQLRNFSLYQFKSLWDVQKRKPEKPPNPKLSEAQIAAYAARRREHYPYLPQFLQQREVVRRTKAAIPVLIGQKIPNPLSNFEGYAMVMMTLLKPWRIPLPEDKNPGPELKSPEQSWTDAFKEWRAELDRKDRDNEPHDQIEMRQQARDFIKHWGSFFEGAELAKAETAARKAAGKDSGKSRRRGVPVPGFEMDGYDSDSGMFDPDEEEGLSSLSYVAIQAVFVF